MGRPVGHRDGPVGMVVNKGVPGPAGGLVKFSLRGGDQLAWTVHRGGAAGGPGGRLAETTGAWGPWKEGDQLVSGPRRPVSPKLNRSSS